MRYEELTREVRDICGAWLTEAQIDATAQAIWAAHPDRMGMVGVFGAAAVTAWMIEGDVIPEEAGMLLSNIVKKLMEDDEPCGLVN